MIGQSHAICLEANQITYSHAVPSRSDSIFDDGACDVLVVVALELFACNLRGAESVAGIDGGADERVGLADPLAHCRCWPAGGEVVEECCVGLE